VGANDSPEKLRLRPEPDLAPPPLRLSGATVTRSATGTDRAIRRPQRPHRAPRGNGRHGVALPPDRRPHSATGRRRRADLRAVVASILGVLALVGCVIAILMLATEPTAAKLEAEIGSLNSRLGKAQSQLVRLQGRQRRAASQRSDLTKVVHDVDRHLTGLQRTVHGLQSSVNLGQEAQAGLRACVPQLQQELTGLILNTHSVSGRVTRVALSDPPVLSSACQALFSGL
jgi:hypothetical protein